MKSLMLAAGLGRRLFGDDNQSLPKALLEIGGKTLLQRHIDTLVNCNVKELILIVGHGKEALIDEALSVAPEGFIRSIFNPRFAESPMYSLWTARDILREGGTLLFMDADVLYHPVLLKKLLKSQHQNCLVVDQDFEDGEEPVKVCVREGVPVDFGKKITGPCSIIGEWPGFMRISPTVAEKIAKRAEEYIARPPVTETYEEAIRDVLTTEPSGTFDYMDVTGIPWIEIDFPEDLTRAKEVILPRIENFDDSGWE